MYIVINPNEISHNGYDWDAVFNPQISPQRNRLRHCEIGFAFHLVNISQGPDSGIYASLRQADYTDCNEVAKSVGLNPPEADKFPTACRSEA